MTQQTEALRLADALDAMDDGYSATLRLAAAELRRLDELEKAYNLLLERTYAQPVDIAALVEGMEVSIDVSTGDHDSGNRLFGTVTLAQENQGSKHGLILLVQDPEANFKTTTQPAAQRQPLPAHEIVTMYEENPTSDSDMIAFARVIEAAHGIGEKK